MKEVLLPKTCLGRIHLHDAFEFVFGEQTLKIIHGDTWRVNPWKDNNTRTLQFRIQMNNVPSEIKRFICGDTLKITNKQSRQYEGDTHIHVNNKLRMHFVGAEMFSVRPSFSLEHEGGQTYIRGKIEHRARLPIPLNNICEQFMSMRSQHEIDYFATVLKTRIGNRGPFGFF